MDFQEKEFGKLQNMNDEPKKESSELFNAEIIEGRELVQEPSGVAEYLQNAGQYYAGQEESIKQDPRIPAGGGHTEEEYLALPDDLRVELIDGVFYAMASPARIHQAVAIEIVRQLWDCIEEHGKEECFVYIAPSDVALGEDKKTVVQPDVYVHCDLEKDIQPGPYRGAPDFALEVLSPSNPENDLWRKRELYCRHGVREYWIVDPWELAVYVFDFEKADEGNEVPEIYTFQDKVPVRISDGACRIDFWRVYDKIKHFSTAEDKERKNLSGNLPALPNICKMQDRLPMYRREV